MTALVRSRGRTAISGGLRYASINHDYRAREIGGANGAIDADSDFHGIGPTVSWEGQHSLGNYGLGVFAITRGSAVFGESYFQVSKTAGATSAGVIRIDEHLQVVPIGEIQIGLDYQRPTNYGMFYTKLALESQFWLNGGTAIVLGPEDSTTDGEFQDPTNEDTGFAGISFSVGLIR